MKKRFFLLILIVIAIGIIWKHDALLTSLGLGLEEIDASDRAQVTVKVITQPVQITSNDRTFRAVGTGRAKLSIGIYPAVSEEVTDIYFVAQQDVKKGDILVQLDSRAEELAVKAAQVQLKDAQSLLDRYELAVKAGGVPESEVDAARADFEAAQVELEQAKLDLEERQIKAPFNGVVGIPAVDPGDRVNPETLITGLDARDTLYIDFEVPESLAGALQNAAGENRKITATTPAYLSKQFDGEISAQESRIDPDRRTVLARAEIDNKEDLLRPGMSFETEWDIKGESYPTVPEISVQWGREGSFIWLIKDGKAVKTSATIISRKAGRVLLEGDIESGDQVVIEGLQRLRPGQSVEIVGTAEE